MTMFSQGRFSLQIAAAFQVRGPALSNLMGCRAGPAAALAAIALLVGVRDTARETRPGMVGRADGWKSMSGGFRLEAAAKTDKTLPAKVAREKA